MKHEPVSRGLEDFLAYLRDAEERHRMAEASRAEADAAEETKTILAEAEQRCQALKQNAQLAAFTVTRLEADNAGAQVQSEEG